MKPLTIFFAFAALAANAGISGAKSSKRELMGWQWDDPSFRFYNRDQNKQQSSPFAEYFGKGQNSIGSPTAPPPPNLFYGNGPQLGTPNSVSPSSIPAFSSIGSRRLPAIPTHLQNTGNSPIPADASPTSASSSSAPSSTAAPLGSSSTTLIPDLTLRQSPDPAATTKAVFTTGSPVEPSGAKQTIQDNSVLPYIIFPPKVSDLRPVQHQIGFVDQQRTEAGHEAQFRIPLSQNFPTSFNLPVLSSPQMIDYNHPDAPKVAISGFGSGSVQPFRLSHGFDIQAPFGGFPLSQTGLTLNLGGFGGLDYSNNRQIPADSQPLILGIAKVGLGMPQHMSEGPPQYAKIELNPKFWQP